MQRPYDVSLVAGASLHLPKSHALQGSLSSESKEQFDVFNLQSRHSIGLSPLESASDNKNLALNHAVNLANQAHNVPPATETAVPTAGAAVANAANNRKRLSMSDVTEMLYEYYKTNLAKAPKTQQQQQQQSLLLHNKGGHTSPASAETHEPSSIAAIATNGAAAGIIDQGNNLIDSAAAAAVAAKALATLSKNLQRDEMMITAGSQAAHKALASSPTTMAPTTVPSTATTLAAPSFQPRIKYVDNKSIASAAAPVAACITSATEIASSSAEVAAQRYNATPVIMTAIPTSVLVPTSPQTDVKPVLDTIAGFKMSPSKMAAAASVIRPVPSANTSALAENASATTTGNMPQAAAIAAALFRDGYHSFQQQLRAQEILRQTRPGRRKNVNPQPLAETPAAASKILESLLRRQQQGAGELTISSGVDTTKEEDETNSDINEEMIDDEEDSRYNGFDDIHLIENSKHHAYGFQQGSSATTDSSASMINAAAAAAAAAEYAAGGGNDPQKYMLAQVQALSKLDYSFGDFTGSNASGMGSGGGGGGSSPSMNTECNLSENGEPIYECRHCGKKYRWKSTLRRHENVECGGKEPSHQCPYCPYKSKQRGNLGVHVRKHHANLPQLESKRRSKYSVKLEGSSLRLDGGVGSSNLSSATNSDDSSSKLIIDCAKQE